MIESERRERTNTNIKLGFACSGLTGDEVFQSGQSVNRI